MEVKTKNKTEHIKIMMTSKMYETVHARSKKLDLKMTKFIRLQVSNSIPTKIVLKGESYETFLRSLKEIGGSINEVAKIVNSKKTQFIPSVKEEITRIGELTQFIIGLPNYCNGVERGWKSDLLNTENKSKSIKVRFDVLLYNRVIIESDELGISPPEVIRRILSGIDLGFLLLPDDKYRDVIIETKKIFTNLNQIRTVNREKAFKNIDSINNLSKAVRQLQLSVVNGNGYGASIIQ